MGNIWLYGDGLNVIMAGTGEVVSIEENIKEGRLIDFTMCHQIFEDIEQNIWLGTNAGLCVFNSNDHSFKIYNDTNESGYVKHNYNCIIEKSDGKVWAGTFGEGVFILSNDLSVEKKIKFKEMTNDQHYDLLWIMYETKGNREVWIGCQQGRLIRYDNTTRKFSFFNDTVFDNKTIMSITEDDNGNIFFGTNGGRVVQRNRLDDKFSVIYQSRQLESRTAAGTITSLACIDKQLLIGTYYDGIIKQDLNTKSLEHYKMEIDRPGSLKSNNIFCFLPDEHGGYFMGTSNGLGYYDVSEKKFNFYTLYDGLPFSNVYDLVFDNNKNMIASTSDGIYRINWKLKSFERVDKNANLYKGFNSICLRKGGQELLLADDDYLYSLTVTENQEKKLPLSYIYAINSFDKTYYPGNTGSRLINFDKYHNTVNIHFGASTFKYHNSIDYYYMLEGIDDKWIPARSNRIITYNELKGGEYVFHLKCVFQENKDSVQELSTSFIIAKPFHQTIWFYLVLVFGISIIFYLIYRARVNKLLAIEKIRFDLSKDLHDDMGSTLSTINILSLMAENKIHKEPGIAKDYLKRINSISQEMMNSMDDIIWSINPVNDNMERVVVRMREFAAGILEPLDINLIFEADLKVDTITTKMKWRRDFFLIFKEAINNAAKYSRCQNLRVQLMISNGTLSLIITDDGRGFDPVNSNNGNGLTNMHKRAGEIGAKLQIESKENMGTRITLIVPLNKL
jgi:signal transduction histidine kinase